MSKIRRKRIVYVLCVASCAALLSGCVQKMASQPHARPLEESAFFENGQSARPVMPGTVPSGYRRNNTRDNEEPRYDPQAQELPFPLTLDVLARGQERYNIYCAVCHAATGEGDGMIVRRGFSRPPSFQTDRLRAAPIGHFYDVMTKGFGAMPSYGAQVPSDDRWAIAAYIRALQLARNATLDDVPAEKRSELEKGVESK